MLTRGVVRFLIIFIWPLLLTPLIPVIAGVPGWTIGAYISVYIVMVLLALLHDVAYGAAIRFRRERRNDQEKFQAGREDGRRQGLEPCTQRLAARDSAPGASTNSATPAAHEIGE